MKSLRNLSFVLLVACGVGLAEVPCEQKLTVCDNYVVTLKAENAQLRLINAKQKEDIEKALNAAREASSEPLLPTWAWVVLGAAAGAATYHAVK